MQNGKFIYNSVYNERNRIRGLLHNERNRAQNITYQGADRGDIFGYSADTKRYRSNHKYFNSQRIMKTWKKIKSFWFLCCILIYIVSIFLYFSIKNVKNDLHNISTTQMNVND